MSKLEGKVKYGIIAAIFNGYKMPTEAVEEWTRRLVERRLG
jgi:hypothetical protein